MLEESRLPEELLLLEESRLPEELALLEESRLPEELRAVEPLVEPLPESSLRRTRAPPIPSMTRRGTSLPREVDVVAERSFVEDSPPPLRSTVRPRHEFMLDVDGCDSGVRDTLAGSSLPRRTAPPRHSLVLPLAGVSGERVTGSEVRGRATRPADSFDPDDEPPRLTVPLSELF